MPVYKLSNTPLIRFSETGVFIPVILSLFFHNLMLRPVTCPFLPLTYTIIHTVIICGGQFYLVVQGRDRDIVSVQWTWENPA